MDEPIPINLVIDGERIQTIDGMIDALERSEDRDKYDLALFCYGKLDEAHNKLEDDICRLFDYVSSSELSRGHHDTQEENSTSGGKGHKATAQRPDEDERQQDPHPNPAETS